MLTKLEFVKDLYPVLTRSRSMSKTKHPNSSLPREEDSPPTAGSWLLILRWGPSACVSPSGRGRGHPASPACRASAKPPAMFPQARHFSGCLSCAPAGPSPHRAEVRGRRQEGRAENSGDGRGLAWGQQEGKEEEDPPHVLGNHVAVTAGRFGGHAYFRPRAFLCSGRAGS